MKESFYKITGKISRTIPNFKGKYRVGKILRKILFPKLNFNLPVIWVKMKDGFKISISLTNDTDFIAFWCGIYDTRLINKFKKIFESDWVILDVGANIGYYTIPFSLSENGTVYSFEPVSENYNQLKRSVQKNKCENVHLFNLGLGEKNEKLGICLTEKGNSGNAVLTNEVLEKERGFFPTEYVEIERLDDFYNDKKIERCDFIKIDIEGAEIFFLRGAKNVITKFRPIIYGEFNSYFIIRNNQSFKEVWEMFTSLDYSIYIQNKSSNGMREVTFSKVEIFSDLIQDVLLIPNEIDKSKIDLLIN